MTQLISRRTVALMLESDGPGGAEVMLLRLAESLRDRGWRVVPVGPEAGCGWLAGEFRNRGFLPETFTLRRAVDPGCADRLARTLAARRVDVVHSHEFTMGVYGALAASRLRIPHVITMHGGKHFAEAWRRRVALRWAARRSRAVVAVSEATRRHLTEAIGLRAADIAVVPNGVPTPNGKRARVRDELRLGADEPLVLAVGNLYPVKGHRVLLDALGILAEREPQRRWRMAIAGRGEEEGNLREQAARLGIADRLHLLGQRSDIADLLAAADLWTMPSLSEGLPLALLEAMMAGLPIVSSAVGGIPEVVRDGKEALLVPSEDPAALAGAIARLLDDAALRATLGRAAKAVAERSYHVDAMTDGYEGLYGVAPAVSHAEVEVPVPAMAGGPADLPGAGGDAHPPEAPRRPGTAETREEAR